MEKKQPGPSNINSISRAFDILRLFQNEWELGIQDISRLSGLNKTTVFRVVKSLEANCILEQNSKNSKYHPGFAIVELAHSVYTNFDVKYIFHPYMKSLREEFNEDVVLSVLSDVRAVCIERFMGDNAINLSSRVGRTLPLYGGSTARVFLPFLSAGKLQRVCEDLQNAPTEVLLPPTKEELIDSLNFVREHGFLSSCGVTDAGVLSVSIPIPMDRTHIYSLGICGVESRMLEKGVDLITSRMLQSGKQIAEKLACCDVIGK